MARPAEIIRNVAQTIWSGASVAERGRNYLLHQHPTQSGRFMLDTSIGPLHIAGTETEIDTAWVATSGAWQYQMVGADFHAFSRNQLGVGTMYRYQHPGSGEFVEFQPLALNWVNASDSRQQITQPQSVVAQVINGDTLYFSNGYGTGRHFQYTAQTAKFQKLITIDALANLPTPTVTGAAYLEIEFVITKSSGVTEWIDGQQWDRSTRMQTASTIEYRASGGTVLWVLDYPRAWDSLGNEIVGLMTLRRQGANRLVTVRIPKTWIDAAVFPIFLDPTIDVAVAAGTDDAAQRTDGSTFTATSTVAGMNANTDASLRGNGGFRFLNITIAAGSTIDVAYMTGRSQNTSNDDPNLDIYGNDVDGAVTFAAGADDVVSRTLTTASAAWVATGVGAGDVNTPSIVSIIQEIVDRGGWASGNDIAILMRARGDTNTVFNWRTYEFSTTICARLHIEYTAGGGAVSLPLRARPTYIWRNR